MITSGALKANQVVWFDGRMECESFVSADPSVGHDFTKIFFVEGVSPIGGQPEAEVFGLSDQLAERIDLDA